MRCINFIFFISLSSSSFSAEESSWWGGISSYLPWYSWGQKQEIVSNTTDLSFDLPSIDQGKSFSGRENNSSIVDYKTMPDNTETATETAYDFDLQSHILIKVPKDFLSPPLSLVPEDINIILMDASLSDLFDMVKEFSPNEEDSIYISSLEGRIDKYVPEVYEDLDKIKDIVRLRMVNFLKNKSLGYEDAIQKFYKK